MVADGDDQQAVWRLIYRGAQVAELEVDDSDFPWLHAHLRAVPAFEELRPLFEGELKQIEADEPAWEATYNRIRKDFELLDLNGTPVAEFLLRIDGDRAWWRWSDTPFDAG